jgi:hypothetical protein
MPTIFEKLNLKNQKEILVLNPPASFEPELARLSGVNVRRSLDEVGEVTFSLVFVTRQVEVDTLSASIAKKTKGDAVVWFAYPKGSSKRYKCDFNRDTGWNALGPLGFEGVRQVAIDEDWSALRFRRAEYIKSMIRDEQRAMSSTGREKLKKT